MQLKHGLVIGLVVILGLLVSAEPAQAQDPCRVDQVLSPGQSCTVDIPNVNVGTNVFQVTSDGRGCYGSICSSGSMNLNGFRASRIGQTSDWRIEALPTTPVPVLPMAGQVFMALLLGGVYLVNRFRMSRSDPEDVDFGAGG